MALKIKKQYLLGLGTWLNEQQVSGRVSRERTRFVTKIQEELAEIDKERITIAEEYAEKDEVRSRQEGDR